jgi:hypothetical protein
MPMPMPTPTHAHGFWVGMGVILCSWAGMGGRGCDIIFHGWAWAIAKNHDNGTEILVVSNLNARIELEFSMYETYKVTDLEKK